MKKSTRIGASRRCAGRIIFVLFVTMIAQFTLLAEARDRTAARLARIIDGDTLVVDLAGRREHVRLIGIDAPEKEFNDKAGFDARRTQRDVAAIVELGKRSRRQVETLLARESALQLEFDVEKRDRYGRILAYVYLSDGTMLNERIIDAGYARLMTKPPNVRHVDRLRAALARAKRGKHGLWAETTIE